MDNYVTAETVKRLRTEKNITQKQLAEKLCVSEKTISKWETGRGLPDISLLEPLAASLNVSVSELLSGDTVKNKNVSANLLRAKFYVCPVCGNIIWSTGEGAFSCCGVNLPPLEAEVPDSEHEICIEKIEDERFISINHPMTKQHFISFFANVTSDRVQIVHLYPEQNAEARFYLRSHGILYAYCNHHGLFKTKF